MVSQVKSPRFVERNPSPGMHLKKKITNKHNSESYTIVDSIVGWFLWVGWLVIIPRFFEYTFLTNHPIPNTIKNNPSSHQTLPPKCCTISIYLSQTIAIGWQLPQGWSIDLGVVFSNANDYVFLSPQKNSGKKEWV